MELNLGQLSGNATEIADAGNYTGKISIMTLETPYPEPTSPPWNGTRCPGWPPAPVPGCTPAPQWNAVSPGPNGTVAGFSGLCYLTGKKMQETLAVPIGLIAGSVGGSPIELWLPKGVLGGACPADEPVCDSQGNLTDSQFYEGLVEPFAPYTLGGVLWDQGERDVHCFAPATNKTAQYPCMQRELINTWREAFKSQFGFVAIQLPGYLGDCDSVSPLQPYSTYYNCVPGVFNMRLAQDMGASIGVQNATVVPTYDLSCPFGVVTPECPFGSVHNVNKTIVAIRAAAALLSYLTPASYAFSPPRISRVTADPTGHGFWLVAMEFTNGNSLSLQHTQYCELCCRDGVGDFDASLDGITFVNGTTPTLSSGKVVFTVGLPTKPRFVRYTANQGFPQCAVVDLKTQLPALPFTASVE